MPYIELNKTKLGKGLIKDNAFKALIESTLKESNKIINKKEKIHLFEVKDIKVNFLKTNVHITISLINNDKNTTNDELSAMIKEELDLKLNYFCDSLTYVVTFNFVTNKEIKENGKC